MGTDGTGPRDGPGADVTGVAAGLPLEGGAVAVVGLAVGLVAVGVRRTYVVATRAVSTERVIPLLRGESSVYAVCMAAHMCACVCLCWLWLAVRLVVHSFVGFVINRFQLNSQIHQLNTLAFPFC